MKKERKDKLRQHFREWTNREPYPHEEVNMEKDWGLCVKLLMEEMEDVQNRLDKLESKVIL